MTAAMSPHLFGPPVFMTLATGLMIAFAVQLLLTTFGIAAGVTAIGYLPDRQADDEASDRSSSSSIDTIGFAVGFGTLLTVNTVLFVACFLAVKLSLVSSPVLGAILGVVIWSGYFLILAWLGSSAVGSLLGAITSTLTAGVQGLTAIFSAVFGRKSAAEELPEAIEQQFASTHAALDSIQQELKAVQSDSSETAQANRSVQEAIQEYLQTLQPPQIDIQAIRTEFANALSQSGLPGLTQAGLLGLDRRALVEILSDRTDFSKQDIGQVVEQLESVWQEVLEESNLAADLTHFLQSAPPEQLSAELNDRLNRLRVSTRSPTQQSIVLGQPLPGVDLKQLGRRLVHTVMQRVDLSDLDVGKILPLLRAIASQFPEGVIVRNSGSLEPLENADTSPFNTIQADVEDFLLNAYPWHLTRKTVKVEFQDVLYDPDADPSAVRRQILPLDREYIESLLQQRDDLSPAKVRKVVDRLDEVRQEVLQRLEAAEAEEQFNTFCKSVADYLQTAKKSVLKPSSLQRQFNTLLRQAGVERRTEYLQRLDRDTLQQMLNARKDLSQKEQEQITEHVKTVRDRLLSELDEQQARLLSEAATLWQRLEKYVRDPGEKLTARTIQRQLKALLKKSKAEATALSAYLPSFDESAVEQWLADRQDLSEKRIRQVTQQLKKAWNQLKHGSESLKSQVEASTEQAGAILNQYLQQLDYSTVDLSSLPQDFLNYLQRHQIQVTALTPLLSVNWEPLLESLDLSTVLDTQQQQAIARQLQSTIHTLSRFPRRFARRTQSTVREGWETLTDYLHSADRDDLTLEAIQHTLNQLLRDLPIDLGQIGNDFSQFDRFKLVMLLTERSDLTPTDIDQIADWVEAVLNQAVTRVQTARHQVQQAIESFLTKFRQSLASLPLLEIDQDHIKLDLYKLLGVPQAGLEWLEGSLGDTLRQQLSGVSREALAEFLQARDDMPSALAHQLIDRVDAVRLGILQQVDHLQQQAQQQVDTLKQQALHQAVETRRAIAIAAWWLFGTALTSITTSAIAGALAVSGLAWWPWG